LGRTPDDDPTTGAAPTTQRLVDHAARRISGQGGAFDGESVAAVWVVSEITPDVEDQLTLAARAGLSVLVLGDEDVEWLLGLGERAELAADEEDVEVDGEDEGAEPVEFRSPEAVLRAYYDGAESVLGVRALPLARLCRSGGSSAGMRDRLERCGLRVALAGGIVRRAMARRGWRPCMGPILRVAYAEDGTMQQAAVALGWGDDDVARRRASRERSRALDLVRDSLEETQARCGDAKKSLTR